jgi:predicted ABC-type transport system involved in lysophospholipase L1 biosynthesis ATPase subunit
MPSASAKTLESQAIVATDLTKWFGQGETKVKAVNGVALVAHFGEMLFIVGPSGSGKTTMLSMLSGILRPNSGTVTVKGTDIWTLDNDQLADFRLNTVGFVFQDYHLFPRLTTADNVAIPLILKQRDWDESITAARKHLEIVGLKGRGDILPVKLSGGEQQRVSISGQTFYTFILENLEKFGALKAIGAKGRELVYMILFMATFTALTGYGLGVGFVTLMIMIARSRLPNYAATITFWNLGLAFGMVVLIAGLSSYVGVRKVLKIEPFDIFRG